MISPTLERRFRLLLRQPGQNLAATNLCALIELELLHEAAAYVPAEAVHPLAWKAWWKGEVTKHGVYTLGEEGMPS